jgi:hypothetical protein
LFLSDVKGIAWPVDNLAFLLNKPTFKNFPSDSFQEISTIAIIDEQWVCIDIFIEL